MRHSIRTRLAVGAMSVALLASIAATVQPASAAKNQPAPTPALEKFYPVVREAATGLPDRTVYRPADMKAVGDDVPLVVWSSGGCRASNTFFTTALTLLAARGFVVVADGAPNAPSDLPTPSTASPERMIDVIDWANDSRDAKKQFENRLDAESVAVMGQSCGGIEALVAGADPRVDTVASLNSGLFPGNVLGYGREELEKLHSPVIFIHGGAEAIEYQNSVDNYNLVDVPAALVSAEGTGHGGIWYGLRDNTQDGTVAVLEEGVEVLVQWLDYTLNDQEEARSYFTGDSGLSAVEGWTVESKGL